MSKDHLAKLVSILLGPHVWLPIIAIIMFTQTGLSSQQVWFLFPSIVFLEVIIPMIYIFLAPKLHWATAWDLPKRQERYPFLAIYTVTTIISLALIYYYGNPILFQLMLLAFALIITLSLITLFWKISLHATLNTVGSIAVIYAFGINYSFILLTIPAIFWSRLTLKRHTFSQLLFGVITSAVLSLIGLFLIQEFH